MNLEYAIYDKSTGKKLSPAMTLYDAHLNKNKYRNNIYRSNHKCNRIEPIIRRIYIEPCSWSFK